MIAVSDSSPLIALSRIQRLEILPMLFTTVNVPTAVYDEVVVQGASRSDASALANAAWLTNQPVTNTSGVAYLLSTLDQGETVCVPLRSPRAVSPPA